MDALYRIYRDEEIKKYVEPLYENRQEEIEFTRAYIENAYKFFGYGIWIMETHDGNVIGRAGLSNREYNGETIVEVGYLLDGQYRNKGYASEALNAVMDYGWNELELSSLYCFIRPDNTHSIKFARKHGFVYEGRAVSEDMEFSVYKRKKPE